MTTGELIKQYRLRKNMTLTDLAKILGYANKSSIARIESGQTDLPQSKLEAIANALGVSPIDLLDLPEKNNQDDSDTHPRPIRIPVYGCIAAGIPIEEIEDIDDWEEINYPNARRGEYIALRIKGDSMEPRICEGDVIIIHLQPTVDNGDLAAVRVNDNYTDGVCATCKKIRFTPDGGIMLISSNPAYEPMYYSRKQIRDEGVEIIGKVVELRAKVG